MMGKGAPSVLLWSGIVAAIEAIEMARCRFLGPNALAFAPPPRPGPPPFLK